MFTKAFHFFYLDKTWQAKINHLQKMDLIRIFTIILIVVLTQISKVFSRKRDNFRKGDENSRNNFLKNNLTSGNYFLQCNFIMLLFLYLISNSLFLKPN